MRDIMALARILLVAVFLYSLPLFQCFSIPYDSKRCVTGSPTCFHGKCVEVNETTNGETRKVEKCVCDPPYDGPRCNVRVYVNLANQRIVSGGGPLFELPARVYRRRWRKR
uniref:EGF-like domain-containing protein n=1 Tax=Schistocephalus solidus TaxID=70667 RepID=A0A0V0J5X7_SCHSO